MDPNEITRKEFPVVMRGYLREEVQAFLAGVSEQLAARDARIARLDAELARAREETATAPTMAPTTTVDRSVLLRHLGDEAASILACADASAERMKAEAGTSTERVRNELAAIGSSLVDVHQLLGELVSLVQGLTEGTALASPSEVTLPDAERSAEVRTVLGEVLGLETGSDSGEIRLPEESDARRSQPSS